jgi:DNA-binding response OmpR family regulator
LYQSILELDGFSVLAAATAAEGMNISRTRVVDCGVIDHKRDGTCVTREFVHARPEVPILFVFDGNQVPLEIFALVEMFVTDDEAIENLPQCVKETIRRCQQEANGREAENYNPDLTPRPLHRALVRWIFPW